MFYTFDEEFTSQDLFSLGSELRNFLAASSTTMESLPLNVLHCGLQMPTGPRQIEETGFAFIHVIVNLCSADIWHEMILCGWY